MKVLLCVKLLAQPALSPSQWARPQERIPYGGDALRAYDQFVGKAITQSGERLMARKVDDERPSGCDAEKPMAISGGRAVTVLLTEEHLRKIIEHHLLKEDEISDPVKLSRVVRKSLDAALGLPDLPWHDWEEWGKGLT